jgi:ABC-2 type transport system permease protein
VRRYRSIVSARFRTLLQYRAAALAGLVTQTFWGLIRVMIFAAFYGPDRGGHPMDYAQVVTYVWLGQAMFRMMPWQADPVVAGMIRTGTVAYELVRPVKLYWLWYSRSVANLAAPTLLRSLPMFALAMLFFGMQPPASPAAAAAWIASTGLALLLASAIATLLTISLLWTVSGQGVAHLVSALVWLLSGLVVPVPLYPDWLQPLLAFLPFRGIMDVPFRIYLGHIPPGQWAASLAHQAAWTIGLIALGRWVLSRGTRRLVVQGG